MTTPFDPYNARVEKVVGNVAKLAEGVPLSSSLLDNIGRVYERHGPEAAWDFIAAKMKEPPEEGEQPPDLSRLLDAVDEVAKAELPRSLSGFIIRKLEAIRDVRAMRAKGVG